MSLAKRNDTQKSKPNPLAAVHLPEFDTSISWAICYNPSCTSFGIPYSGPAPGNWNAGGSVGDRRYRFDIGRRRLHCRNCEHQFRLRSNRAIRSLARYYLSQSLPFADCPNTHCPNHGHNIFEHYHPAKPLKSRRYRRYEEHRAVCRLCGENIRLGEPLAVSRSFQAKKSIREILHGVVRTKSSLSDGIEVTRLFRAARRLRDYHAWRNAALLQKRFSRHTQPVRIYSDEMVVWLRRRGEGDRFLPCGLLLTVMRLDDGSLFVLAAHLKFPPDAQGPSEAEFLSAPVDVADPWDSVGNPYRLDVTKSEKRVLDTLPDIGRRGHFVKAYYAELAHFLVVRKLLSRFPRVFHYMDRDKELNSAALVAFADAIRGGRWEIANFQHEKEPRSVKAKDRDAFEDSPGWRDEGPRSIRERRVENLDREWAAMWKRLEARIDEGGMLKGATRHDPRVLARNYRTAFRGAYAATSKWAWLKHPPQPHQFHDPRVLWTTWNPEKSYESVGRELLWDTNLNPVDSACNALRSRTNGLTRRGTRALAGLESASAVWDPRVIDAELWIQILWRNFGLRRKTKRSRPPAKALCLARKSEGNPDLPGLAWDFRLGMSHAEKMSTPLRRFGLMAAFAEFSLLPELLASVPSAPGTDPPDSWRNILDSHGYNVDHIEDDERLPGTGLTEFMVGDAWALVNRLGLVDGDGLTQAGRALAWLDSTERSNAALYATLGDAVRTTFRGNDGVPLVDLLLHEARRVQAGEADGGAGYCPGLLLAEVITLIEHACLPSPRPRRALLDIRREIEELVIQPDAQRSRNAARCEFADAVSAHHLQASTETEYGEWVPMTLTEARATSMLLTAAGLLDLEFPIGPAQCLAPPRGLATPAATRDRIDAEGGVRIDVRGGAWQLNAPPRPSAQSSRN